MSSKSKRRNREKELKKRQQQQQNTPLLQRLQKNPAAGATRRIWLKILPLPSAIALILTLYSFFPRISVEPGESIDSKSPLETRFIVKNENIFPIYEVEYFPFYKDSDLLYGDVYAVSIINNLIPEIAPFGNQSIRVNPLPPNPLIAKKYFAGSDGKLQTKFLVEAKGRDIFFRCKARY
jgi:hypothetical protein